MTTRRAGSPVLLLLGWLLSLPALAQTLTGKVSNGADNTALPGVTIVEKGSTKGTVTDSDGNYSLRLSSPQATVVLSYIGFVGQEIAVGGRSVLNVALKEDQTQLNEVVVTALGITKDKKALAYSVTEVKGSDFTQARETNVANAQRQNCRGQRVGPVDGSRGIEPGYYSG